LEAGFGGVFFAEVLGEVAVEFNGDDVGGAAEEFFGESAAARADLDDNIGGGGADGGGDAFEDRAIRQEMLAELSSQNSARESASCACAAARAGRR
jgi:hypothetical protein